MKTLLLLGTAAALGWVCVLRRHEEQVKFFHYVQTGERFGCDCTWLNPREVGDSVLFSIPAIKSKKTGKIYRYPLMG